MFTNEAPHFSSTTGGESDPRAEAEQTMTDQLDDVFGDSSEEEHNVQHQSLDLRSDARVRNADVSDVPRLQGIHSTNGYRDGISASKEKFLQEGFDEGYSLGAEIGAAAGRLIGILEALLHAVCDEAQAEISERLVEATKDLSAKQLYGSDFFGEDGNWNYDVSDANGSEADVTFRLVAKCHPSIKKWTSAIEALLRDHGLPLGNLEQQDEQA